MATILTKKKDTTGAPGAGDLTNSTGGAELAVNTADKRLYTKNSGGSVVEVGTNPGEAVTFVAGSASTPAITTTGDTNTGIFFPAADTIAFAEGGVEAMRIDSSGRVGIGISSPTSLMHIASATANLAAFKTTRLVVPAGATTTLGEVVAGAYSTGTTIVDSARISFFSDAIWSSTSTPSSIRFETTSSGSTTYTERMRIDSSGNVGIGTTSPAGKLHVASSTGDTLAQVESTFAGGDARLALIGNSAGVSQIRFGDEASANVGLLTYDHADNSMAFRTDNSERMRIDSSGNVLIGTTTAASTQGGNLQVITAQAIRRNIAGSGGGALRFEKSRSATDGGYTIVSNDDSLGEVQFYGADGVDYAQAASIKAIVNGTPGSNDMPGALVFSTTPDGSATSTERMRITSDGYLRMASGTGGIQFGGDTAAANALDDYEEGTWTPTISNFTLGNGIIQRAEYTKIGNLVTISFDLTWGSTTSATGTMSVTGIPFVAGASGAGTAWLLDSGTSDYVLTAALPVSSGQTIQIIDSNNNISNTFPFTWTTSDRINLCLTYQL